MKMQSSVENSLGMQRKKQKLEMGKEKEKEKEKAVQAHSQRKCFPVEAQKPAVMGLLLTVSVCVQ